MSVPAINCLTFFDSFKSFAGGDSIYRTTDSGEKWQAQSVQPEMQFGLTDIYFAGEQYGWAVGISGEWFDAGIILKTDDCGETWQVNVHPASATGMGAYFTDSLNGYVVGSNPPFFEGVIMHTEDGGENWDVQYLLNCSWLNDVVFTDDSTGWVVGDYGFIWYTEDDGSTWQKVESGTNADLGSIVFVEDGKVGYIFGDNNTLLKYDRTSEIVMEDNFIVPNKFKLHQNYPNPFNLQTVIDYELEKPANVILKVYNLIGKEVVTLVNEKRNPGSYHAIWNGRDKYGKEVSSGIYFCELKAGYNSQVHKMVLTH